MFTNENRGKTEKDFHYFEIYILLLETMIININDKDTLSLKALNKHC